MSRRNGRELLSRRRLLGVAVLAAAASAVAGPIALRPDRFDVAPIVERLRATVPGLLARYSVPGMAIGICDASTVLWTQGFGTLRAGGERPVTTQTIFNIGSCTKMYAATAVLLAVQQGLVDLDEPVTTYLPEFTVRSRFEDRPERRITLRHLLSHTSGLTREPPVGSYYEPDHSLEERCLSIPDTWLRFPVGHHYAYSNCGIDLAGYVLQRVAGIPFTAFVERQLLDPLGLERTTLDHLVYTAEPDRADGHRLQLGGEPEPPTRIASVASGAAYASVADACRYLQFHLNAGAGLLGSDLWAEMFRIPFARPGQEAGYGLGVGAGPIPGHSGGGFGFNSDMYWSPEAGIGVAMMINAEGSGLQSFGVGVLQDLAGTGAPPRAPALPPAVPVTTAEQSRLIGEYLSDDWERVRITGTATGLRLLDWGGPPGALRPVAPDEYVVETGDRARFRILPGAGGAPAYLQRIDNGYVWYRNDVPVEAGGEEPAWEGEYAVMVNGIDAFPVELRRGSATVRNGVDITVGLEQYAPGVFVSATGEVLDLTRNPPTYANIKLWPVSTPRQHPRK